MKLHFFLISFTLLILSHRTFAQNSESALDQRCILIPKNGKIVDTVKITGYPAELIMFPTGGNPSITYLENKHYIKRLHKFSSLKVTCDSCPAGYWILTDDRSEQAKMLISKKTQKVELTCVVYRKIPSVRDEMIINCIRIRSAE